MTYFRTSTKKYFFEYVLLLISTLFFFLRQCWLYKKPTAKMLVTFIFGNKNCKRAWKFPQKALITTVCI